MRRVLPALLGTGLLIAGLPPVAIAGDFPILVMKRKASGYGRPSDFRVPGEEPAAVETPPVAPAAVGTPVATKIPAPVTAPPMPAPAKTTASLPSPIPVTSAKFAPASGAQGAFAPPPKRYVPPPEAVTVTPATAEPTPLLIASLDPEVTVAMTPEPAASSPLPPATASMPRGGEMKIGTAIARLSNGYRVDNLEWDIASDLTGTTTPNILSELKWKDVRSYEVKAEVEYTVPEGPAKNVYVETMGSIAWVQTGDNQDSDYYGDNRTQEFSRSNSDADRGTMNRFAAAVGYTFAGDVAEGASVGITPLLGYSIDQQGLRMRDAYQTRPFLDEDGDVLLPTGPFPGLKSTYDTNWHGTFFGLKLKGQAGAHRLGLRSEYHLGDYRAEANWNLREEFWHPLSFEHEAEADGYFFSLDYGYSIHPRWEIFFQAMYQTWDTDSGSDRTFFFTPGDSVVYYSDTRLNDVDWDSQAYHVGVAYRW